MQPIYWLRVKNLYQIKKGYFIIDDTIIIRKIAKCPGIDDKYIHTKKHKLAIEMIRDAIENNGFHRCTVLADFWYGIEPFIKDLKRLKLSYILEITTKNKIKVDCIEPKRTPTGKMTKKQYELKSLKEYFKSILGCQFCGFAEDEKSGKSEKVLYHTKVATVRLNAMPEKQRVIQSYDTIKGTSKYLITNQLTWEAVKIISEYNVRWAIEEFFRNAKQLTDMEGATIRSEQGVTLSLNLVSWIDFLLHYENYKQSTAGELTKESLTNETQIVCQTLSFQRINSRKVECRLQTRGQMTKPSG